MSQNTTEPYGHNNNDECVCRALLHSFHGTINLYIAPYLIDFMAQSHGNIITMMSVYIMPYSIYLMAITMMSLYVAPYSISMYFMAQNASFPSHIDKFTHLQLP